MSVVVWDGKTLATDRQQTVGSLRICGGKSRRMSDGTVLAWTGHTAQGLAAAAWYEAGADPEKFPGSDDKEKWSRLIVMPPGDGPLFYYEDMPHAIVVEEEKAAWGAGGDFALGAMAMGANARGAVDVACRFSVECGMGIDAYDRNA